MGFWIIEPKGSPHVPGTVKLLEYTGGSGTNVLEQGPIEENPPPPHSKSHLKHGTGKNADVFLVPQPSDSPNDPLNWPVWKKDLTLFIICLGTAGAATVGPSLAPINQILAEEFKTSYTTVANFVGYQFLAAGVAGLFCEVAARIWGKRPVYIISTALLFAGTLWNVFARSVGSFMGSRVLQGLGMGAFETLVVASIGDMYFVHQRGKRIAFYNLLFLGTSYFVPVIAGHISHLHGWRAEFVIISAFLGPILLLVFFFCPEHVYNRSAKLETDYASQEDLSVSSEGFTSTTSIALSASSPEKPKSFTQELRLFNGRFSNDSFFKLLLAPFPCMLYPATIWAFIFQGTFVTWGIGIGIVLAELFSGPPTFFTTEQIGYVYAAPAIGAILAYIAGVFSADSIAKYFAKRNNNIYEPEFRIALVIPVLLTGIPGLIAYGYVVDAHLHWIVPSVMYALLTFAVVMSCTATYAYVLDAHRDLSVEMMVAVLLLKNIFAWGSTYYLPNWVIAAGPKKAFMVMGCIQAGICVLSGVMWVYGKYFRWWMYKLGIMKRLGLYPGEKIARNDGGETQVVVASGEKV